MTLLPIISAGMRGRSAMACPAVIHIGDSMTTILATVGDLHINSTVGLLTPTVNLDDGGTFSSSKGQKFLWRNWLSFWDEVQEVAKKNKAKVWTVFNGDMVDVFVKYQTVQLISHNDTDVMDMVLDTIMPAVDASDKIFVVRGTAAHGRQGAPIEEKIAEDISAVEDGDKHSWWHLLLDCDRVLFDITHHGRLGGMQWTKTNSLNKLVAQLIIKYRNRKIPDVALRSHMHQYGRSDNSFHMEAYALPAWQLFTEFTHRIGAIEPPDIGGMYFICDKGQYTPVVKRYPIPQKQTWKG